MNFVTYNHPTLGEIQVPIDPELRGPGVKEGAIAGAWTAGVNSKVQYEIVVPNFDWRGFWFSPEKQYFDSGDLFACTNFSDNNSAKVQLKQSTGEEYDLSEAWSALTSGTEPGVGNYMDAPSEAARKVGRMLQVDWPNGNSVADFYRPLTDEVKKKAFKLNEAHEYIDTSYASIQYHLKQAPINILIKPGNTNHDVCVLFVDSNGIWCGDSYPHSDNSFLFITTQVPLAALKNVVKPMNTILFGHRKNTQEYGAYVISPAGRFFIPASTPDDLKARGVQYPTTPDGKVDYSKAIDIDLP